MLRAGVSFLWSVSSERQETAVRIHLYAHWRLAKKNRQVQPKSSYRLWFATKSSHGHQRVEIHRNTPQKRAQRDKNALRCTQICATWYDLRQNRLLCIKVSICTKIGSKNLLNGTKNPQVQSKPSNRLSFATKSSPTRKEIFRTSSRFRRLASENDSYMRSGTQSRANDTQCLKCSTRCRARCERHHRELIENHRRAQHAKFQLSTSHCENHINVVI